MPNRRDIVKGIGSSLALGLAGTKAGFAASTGTPLPTLPGVDFLTPAMPEGRRLAMAFNRETQKVPELRAVCRTGQAVGEAVKWASDGKMRFAVHSSGHCFAGHSMHDKLVIDTSNLNHIQADTDNKRVTAGAGAFIGHVYERLAASRQGLAGGTYGSVCVAGMTLGGGIGYLARSAGLLCDQLEEITLVDASGTLVRASREENADLFWASCGGGGGSFGIATEMTFRTRPVPDRTIIYVFMAVPFEQAARIVHDWQYWSSEAGRQTTTHLFLSRRSKRRYLVSLTGESTLPRKDILHAVQKFLGPENPMHENSLVDYYSPRGVALLKNWDEIIVPVDFMSKSDYLNKPVPASGVAHLLEVLEQYPPAAVKLTFSALGGAVADVAPQGTAYPHRGASSLVEFRSEFRNIFERERYRRALDEVRAVFKSHVSGGVYVNYPFPDLENWAEAYWGLNLPRLMDIKRKWDPDNLFRHAQSVPPN